jgi:hypothetical protein
MHPGDYSGTGIVIIRFPAEVKNGFGCCKNWFENNVAV